MMEICPTGQTVIILTYTYQVAIKWKIISTQTRFEAQQAVLGVRFPAETSNASLLHSIWIGSAPHPMHNGVSFLRCTEASERNYLLTSS
jgi:hypothetical protein